MTKRIKQEAAGPVPQTREETVEAIAAIGRAQQERKRIEADMNDDLAVIKKKYEELARPHNETISANSRGVQLYCEAHRDELLAESKQKTVNLASGEVKWRMRPPSVSVRGAEAVISWLKEHRLHRFVRTKEEVNKELVLSNPKAVEGIKGISITQKEDFVIVPFETDLEEIA